MKHLREKLDFPDVLCKEVINKWAYLDYIQTSLKTSKLWIKTGKATGKRWSPSFLDFLCPSTHSPLDINKDF